MKATAPEKIYLVNDDMNIKQEWYKTKQVGFDTIEYIRKDAFIERAMAYLNSKFYFHNAFYGVVSTDFSAMEELFEDFENYMEGE